MLHKYILYSSGSWTVYLYLGSASDKYIGNLSSYDLQISQSFKASSSSPVRRDASIASASTFLPGVEYSCVSETNESSKELLERPSSRAAPSPSGEGDAEVAAMDISDLSHSFRGNHWENQMSEAFIGSPVLLSAPK